MIILENQRILVIGGSSGIGLATAKMVQSAGGNVTIASRSQSKIDTAMQAIGGGLAGRTIDILDDRSVDQFFIDRDEWDHVVVTASEVRVSAVREMSIADAMQAMNSKFWGAYRVARVAKIKSGGSLSFIAGYLSHRPTPNRALMAAINSALEGLTRGLALEFRPTRVNAVSPAFVDTPLWGGLSEADRSELIEKNAKLYPAGRVGSPSDVAQLLLLFISNAYATGTVVTLDGGASLV